MEEKTYSTQEKIPAWAICYLVNGDLTGLTEEEIETVQKWEKDNKVIDVSPKRITGKNGEEGDIAEPYFSSYPAFGLPTDVYDCDVICME